MHSRQIQKLIDVNPDPVIIAERNTGRIVYFNTAADINVISPRFGSHREQVVNGDPITGITLYTLINPAEHAKLPPLLKASGSEQFTFITVNGFASEYILTAEEYDKDNQIISLRNAISIYTSEDSVPHEQNDSFAAANASARVETIINNLPMVMLELDSEGRFLLQEGSALSSVGYKPGQLVGTLFQEVLGNIQITGRKGEIMTAVDAFNLVMKGNVVAGHTFLAGRFFDNYFVPVRKKGTKPSGMLGICLDITERVNFERSYRNTEQRFRLIAETTSELISMVSGREYIYISPSYEKIFGYTLDEIKAMGPKSLVHPADLPLLDDWQKKGMVEFRVRNKNGEYRWIEGESFVISGDPAISVGIARDVTKRKNAEEALKDNEEKYRILFDRNPLPMFVYDEETFNFLAVNESAIDHYGYSREEFLKMTIMDIRPNVDIPELMKIFREHGKGMKRFGVWRHILKNGMVINVNVTTHSITFNDRRARLVLAEDVTAKVKAENALRESEEKYRRIVENANEGILLINGRQQVTFVNPKLASIVGYKRDELENRPVINFLFKEDIPLAEKYITENVRGSKAEFEFRLKHKDGSERWVEVNAVPVTDENNVYAGGLALITDITNQRKRASEYHRLNELLHSLINYAPLSIIILDRDGNTELWNNASETMFGWNSDEVLGKPLPFVTEEYMEEHLSFRKLIMKGGSFTDKEIVRVRKDGRKINVSLAAAPLYDSDHKPIGISSFLIDITEKRRSQREREKLFKQITAARNRLKILSSRLISVQESEKRNISRELHDEIGQMLTAIKIDVQRIKNGGTETETARLADDCTRLVEKSISVVRNLSLELRPAIIDDLGLAASLRWYLDKFHQRTGLKVKIDIKKISVILPPDCAITLFRICQEALTNIAKHAEADYVKVSLKENKSDIVLIVEDDGKGFDTKKALRDAAGGKSLGLISMQERAELLGGKFNVRSSKGSGTIIEVSCKVKQK